MIHLCATFEDIWETNLFIGVVLKVQKKKRIEKREREGEGEKKKGERGGEREREGWEKKQKRKEEKKEERIFKSLKNFSLTLRCNTKAFTNIH